MNGNLVYLRPLRVGFIRAVGPYSEACPRAWKQMIDWLTETGLRTQVNQGFGLSRDNPDQIPASERRYDACIELPKLVSETDVSGLSFCTLPGGTYARHRHVGDHKQIGPMFRDIRDKWEKASGLQIDQNRPFVAIYIDDPDCYDLEDLRTDLCVPVAPVEVGADN